MPPSHDDTELHLDLVDLATTMAFVVMSVGHQRGCLVGSPSSIDAEGSQLN